MEMCPQFGEIIPIVVEVLNFVFLKNFPFLWNFKLPVFYEIFRRNMTKRVHQSISIGSLPFSLLKKKKKYGKFQIQAQKQQKNCKRKRKNISLITKRPSIVNIFNQLCNLNLTFVVQNLSQSLMDSSNLLLVSVVNIVRKKYIKKLFRLNVYDLF